MDKLQSFDLGFVHWFQTRHFDALDTLMGAITWVGDKRIVPLVALAIGLIFAANRLRRTGACYVLACLVALFLTLTVKWVILRPRPEITQHIVAQPTSPSFPSGHSLNSMAIFGGAALVASRRVRYRVDRMMLILLGVGLALLIGVSRMYIGVHYFTDVLGGWSAGLACALFGYWMAERWGEPAVWEEATAAPPADSPS